MSSLPLSPPLCPSPPAFRFASLAVVEQQLCFQPLSLADRLALAQCSRTLRRIADHPLAWRSCEIARVDLLKLDPAVGLSPFLRHVPLSPRWSSSGWRLNRGMDMILKAKLTLYELDSSRCSSSPIWKDLLDPSLPMPRACLSKLVRLRLTGYDSPPRTIDVIRYIASIPTLRALHIKSSLSDSTVWTTLASMHALTSLIAECDGYGSGTNDGILALQALPNLTHLGVTFQPRCSVSLRQLLSSPSMRRLRSLSVVGNALCFGNGNPGLSDDDLQATFSEMHALESMHFARHQPLDCADRMLRHGLMYAPALTQLIIELSVSSYQKPHNTPSIAAFEHLLAARPLLSAELHLSQSSYDRDKSVKWDESYGEAMDANLKRRFRIVWKIEERG